MAGANRSKWVHQPHFKVTCVKGLFFGKHTFPAVARGSASYICLFPAGPWLSDGRILGHHLVQLAARNCIWKRDPRLF